MKLPKIPFVVLLCVYFAAPALAAAAELNSAFLSIRSSDIQKHIGVLADDSFEGREAGSRGGHAAGVYLARYFQKHGLSPAGDEGSYFQTFDGAYRNVLAILEGSDPELKQEFVVVGAHYDHVGYGSQRNSYGPIGYIHNGADDNASGIAGLLEVVEALSSLDQRPKRSILFACWDGEEKGLLGSKNWAAYPTIDLEQIVFMINADMIGRLSGRNVKLYGSRSAAGLRQFVCRENAALDLPIEFTWEMKANSDHHPFYARHIPVLMFHTGLHDDYHRPSDDAHLIDNEGAEQVARLIFNVAYSLADATENFRFRNASRHESVADHQQLELPAAPRPSRMGISWRRQQSIADPIVVSAVSPNSAADSAGILVGDEILSLNGREVADETSFRMRILAAPVESRIAVRRGENDVLELPIEFLGSPVRIGIAWRADEGEPGTVILTRVISGSAAYFADLQLKDRIYEVNGETFRDSEDFQRRVSAAAGELRFDVERNGRLQVVDVDLLPRD